MEFMVAIGEVATMLKAIALNPNHSSFTSQQLANHEGLDVVVHVDPSHATSFMFWFPMQHWVSLLPLVIHYHLIH
jgi:hypothetical protein